MGTLLALQPAQPGDASASDGLSVRLGFDGIVKIGVPLPLDVVLPPMALTGPAELVADAPALGPEIGRVVTSTIVPFQAVAGAAQVIHMPVVVNDPRRPVTIRVSVAGREVLRHVAPISPDQVTGRMLVALSDDHGGLASLRLLPGGVRTAYVGAEALPRLWQEYGAVDLLVIRDLDPSSLDAAQQEALRTWIYLGGRLLMVARHGGRVPSLLEPILPATAGEVRTARALPALATAYGGAFPPGPITVTALAPRAGAWRLSDGDVAIMASWRAGWGQVMISGVDPWQPVFLQWSGHRRWWDAALGGEHLPLVDPGAVAEKLAVGTPLDPVVHAEVGVAIVLYLSLLLGLLRWRPTLAGALAGTAVVVVSLGAFALLAEATRVRSATLTQVTVLEPVQTIAQARATTVAAVAVPYGGPYRITVSPGTIAQPVTPSSDLRIVLSAAIVELSGTLRPGEPARPFASIGVVPFSASVALSGDGRRLVADFGRLRVRRAELRAHDRVYRVADILTGRSTTEIHPDGWVAASADGGATSELAQHLREAIFQGPAAGAILKGTTPVFVGELEPSAAVFALAGAATPGQRLTLLLVPLEQR